MLAPQKNRAGQRVYRRKDVEMVVRIRDLLYEEKFTIAGAKKKLLDEIRSSSPRSKASVREAAIEEELQESPAPEPQVPPTQTGILPGLSPSPAAETQRLTPLMRTSLRTLKRDLEDLLTLLRSDASITD